MKPRWVALVLVCTALMAMAGASTDAAAPGAVPPSAIKRFVSCPVYRDVDAGRKSSCWLATEAASGVRYDVGQSPAKPQLGRQVLVEGVVSRDDEVCGDPVLNPVRVSVLDRPCPRFMLPAEGYPGRSFVLPEVLAPRHVPRTPPPPPYDARDFTIYFEWGSDFLRYQHAEIVIDRALTYIRASRATRVLVTGYADTQGIRAAQLWEPLSLARARAEMVAKAFARLGVDSGLVRLKWHGAPKPDALAELGLQGPSKRRVTIRVMAPP